MNKQDIDFYTLISRRRSIRKYCKQALDPESVRLLIAAGLRAPSSRNRHSVHFVIVEDEAKITALSQVREHGAAFLRGAPLAIVVLADPMLSQRWREDACIAATYVQLEAESLGLGSCWCQISEVVTAAGQDADEYVRRTLDLPYQLQVLCIISVGHKDEDLPARSEDSLLWERVHIETYNDQQYANE